MACLSLGRFLNNRLQRVDLCKDQPELAREFAGLYGKEYLAALLRRDRAKALRDLEEVFEQAAEKFAGVRLPDGDTVAERAKVELFAIRNLSVGREAPDIGGPGSGRQGIQAERLSREGGVARFLELRLTDVTGPVAPRAVARDAPEGQALRTHRHPRRRQQREATQGGDGEGEDNVAIICGRGHRGRGTDRDEVEPLRHADVLPDRPQGGDPLHVGRRPRRKGHRRRPGETDPGGGGRCEVVTEVTVATRAAGIGGPGQQCGVPGYTVHSAGPAAEPAGRRQRSHTMRTTLVPALVIAGVVLPAASARAADDKVLTPTDVINRGKAPAGLIRVQFKVAAVSVVQADRGRRATIDLLPEGLR